MRSPLLRLGAVLAFVTSSACGGADARSAQQNQPAPNPPAANSTGSPESPPAAAAPAPEPAATAPVDASAPIEASGPTLATGAMSATTQAVEIKVEGLTTASQINGRQARPGHEFVIVSASFRNVIPLKPVDKSASRSPVGGLSGFGAGQRPAEPGNVTMEPTPYQVPMLRKQFWLFTDERYADTVDLDAQAAMPDAFPVNGFGIAKLDDVVRGKLIFEAPAGQRYRTFQFYDNAHGHALIALGGTKPAPAPVVGTPAQNEILQLTLASAGFSEAGPAPAGLRRYDVAVRGTSRSAASIMEIQPQQFVFLQNEGGCIATPERNAAGLNRPMGEAGSFPPTSPNETQLGFFVPDNTKHTRLLVLPSGSTGIALPTAGFALSWPTPQQSIDDGSTLKLHLLPSPPRPASLPSPAAGRDFVVLDVVLESQKPRQGIDFQTTQQLRLTDGAGAFISPSPISHQLSCRIDDVGVIPAGHARRFQLVYDVPASSRFKLQYRGFERDEVLLEIKR